MMEKTIVSSVTDWKGVAEIILEGLDETGEKAEVIVLSGDLGAGKTTFVQALAEVLGVDEVLTSPTFNIIKNYQTTHSVFSNLVHMDAYRLESEAELEPLRFNELLKQPKTLICIEWGEKIKSSIPGTAHFFELEINKDNQHTIQKVS